MYETKRDEIRPLAMAGRWLGPWIPIRDEDEKMPAVKGWTDPGYQPPGPEPPARGVWGLRLDGLTVIDLDDRERADEVRAALGLEGRRTFSVRTPKGEHWYFLGETTNFGALTTWLRRSGLPVDVCSTRSRMVIGPGSVRRDGQAYVVTDPSLPLPVSVVRWPEGAPNPDRRVTDPDAPRIDVEPWDTLEASRLEDFVPVLLDDLAWHLGDRDLARALVSVSIPYLVEGEAPRVPDLEGIDPSRYLVPEGSRNQTLFHFLQALRRCAASEAAVRRAGDVVSQTLFTPPLPSREVEAVARSASQDGYAFATTWDHVTGPDLGELDLPGPGQLEPPDEYYDPQTWEYRNDTFRLTDGFRRWDATLGNWLVEPVLTNVPITVLFGPGGCGKTWLLSTAAALLASGSERNGFKAHEQGSVIYFDGEGSLQLRSSTMLEYLVEQGLVIPPRTFLVADGSSGAFLKSQTHLRNEKGFRDFLQIIEKCRPRLVILDTLSRWLHGFDQNDAAVISEFMAILHEARDYALQNLGNAVNFVIVHHSRKDGVVIRGSTAVYDDVDEVISLSSSSDGRFLTIEHVKNRYGVVGEPFRISMLPVTFEDGISMVDLLVMEEVPESTPVLFSLMTPKKVAENLKKHPRLLTTNFYYSGAPPETKAKIREEFFPRLCQELGLEWDVGAREPGPELNQAQIQRALRIYEQFWHKYARRARSKARGGNGNGNGNGEGGDVLQFPNSLPGL